MREGKFFEMSVGNKSNLFFEKSKHADEEEFKQDVDEYEGVMKEKSGGMYDFLKEHDLSKSIEMREVIDVVVKDVNKMLEKYGLQERVVSGKSLYLLSPEYFKQLPHNEGENSEVQGLCLPFGQVIAVSAERTSTNSELAANMFHEFMHLYSFQRMRYTDVLITEETQNIFLDRNGLMIANQEDPQNYKFKKLNEAITQKLTFNFLNSIHDNPLFKEEFDPIEENFPERAKNGYLRARVNNGEIEYGIAETYLDEVKELDALVQDIYENNIADFASSEEVFDVFAKAYFSGNILELANLIEKTKGKGSFRQLAESF